MSLANHFRQLNEFHLSRAHTYYRVISRVILRVTSAWQVDQQVTFNPTLRRDCATGAAPRPDICRGRSAPGLTTFGSSQAWRYNAQLMAIQDSLIPILQGAISPPVLISGIGLLVLSMTNRFSRTTDRARDLASQRAAADEAQRSRLDVQIRILYRRSRILSLATSLALTSILFAALMIVALFLDHSSAVKLRYLIATLFVASLTSLIVSLVLFIHDMTLSLRALREELRDQR